jgi:hypothetical protein
LIPSFGEYNKKLFKSLLPFSEAEAGIVATFGEIRAGIIYISTSNSSTYIDVVEYKVRLAAYLRCVNKMRHHLTLSVASLVVKIHLLFN